MSDRIAAELREAYSAIMYPICTSDALHLFNRSLRTTILLSADHLCLQFHGNIVYKVQKGRKMRNKDDYTHLSGKGIEYIIRPKTKFDMNFFLCTET